MPRITRAGTSGLTTDHPQHIESSAHAAQRDRSPLPDSSPSTTGLLSGLMAYVPALGSRHGAASTSRRGGASRQTPADVPPYASQSGEQPANGGTGVTRSRRPPVPLLTPEERARFNVGSAPSPHVLTPYPQVLAHWQNRCEVNSDQWYQAWRSRIAPGRMPQRNPSVALQSTARQLDRATDPRVTTLDLRYLPLPCFPEQMHRLAHLQHIDIRGAGLSELPDTISELDQLNVLRLSENPIQSLPASISQLHQLRELCITFCPELTALPEHLAVRNAAGQREGLVNLRMLQLSNTGIQSLPSSITHLKNLEIIDLSRSPITSLPSEIHQLPLLEELDLQGCTALKAYPPIEQRGSHLKSLNLRNCTALRTLPDDIDQLKELEVLDLRGCNRLSTLPASLSGLPENCVIRVSPLMQEQLDWILAIRTPAGQARALEKIEETAYALMDAVLNERNPFLEGAPVYTRAHQPSGSADQNGQAPAVKTRLGDVPAIKTMLDESRLDIFSELLVQLVGTRPEAEGDTPEATATHEDSVAAWKSELSAHLGMLNPDGTPRYHERQELHVENLTKAVQMWRTRERIVNAHPEYRPLFKEIKLYLPAETAPSTDDENTDDN